METLVSTHKTAPQYVYKIYKFMNKNLTPQEKKKKGEQAYTDVIKQELYFCCGLVCVYQCFWRNTLHPSSGQKWAKLGKVVEQAIENWRFKFTMKIEATCSSKMLVMTYYTMQCHNLEDHNINLYRHGNHNQDNI